jgi:hypothetical protein
MPQAIHCVYPDQDMNLVWFGHDLVWFGHDRTEQGTGFRLSETHKIRYQTDIRLSLFKDERV